MINKDNPIKAFSLDFIFPSDEANKAIEKWDLPEGNVEKHTISVGGSLGKKKPIMTDAIAPYRLDSHMKEFMERIQEDGWDIVGFEWDGSFTFSFILKKI